LEEIWNIFKEIVSESIERLVPHKILRKNPDPGYYSKEVKRLKVNNRCWYQSITQQYLKKMLNKG